MMKPFKAWAVVTKRGIIAQDGGYMPAIYDTKRTAENCRGLDEKVVRVIVKEVKK